MWLVVLYCCSEQVCMNGAAYEAKQLEVPPFLACRRRGVKMKKCNDEAEVANIGGSVAAIKPDFSLIDEKFLKSRIYTIRGVKGGRSYSPYAFTEQGVCMLMTVLKGERAVAQSKALIRLFKQMKDYIVAENQQLLGNDGIAEIALQTAQNSWKGEP